VSYEMRQKPHTVSR